MSIRRTSAALAAAACLLVGTPAHAETVDPDPETYQAQNNGESGFQAITVNVAVPAARSTHDDVLLKIAADCEYNTVGDLNVNSTNLVVAGHASTTVHGSHGVPVSTGISCRVYNSTGSLTVERALPGSNVAYAGTKKLGYAPFTMCISVSVHYDDNYFVETNPVCRAPIMPLG